MASSFIIACFFKLFSKLTAQLRPLIVAESRIIYLPD
jgi:hypothetical protein